ncbi:MAG: protein translocase subunit SecF, partial [Clostridia bacterium]|nr:protein translocase subunit SecF [Clostridia bacterium]
MTNIDFIGKRKIFYTISITLIAIGILVSLPFALGVKLDIQFKGGTVIEYSYTDPSTKDGKMTNADKEQAQTIASQVLGSQVSAYLDTDITKSISSRQHIVFELDNKNLTNTQVEDLYTKMNTAFKTYNLQKYDFNTVGASEGQAFFQTSIFAVALASLLIILYIWVRFRRIGGLPAGITAFIALVHDLLMAYAAFSIFRIPLNDSFVAVLLTILGFSINDTIVIYDRIRENRRLVGSKMSFKDIVNKSINQSFTRSINTTLVVFVSITVVFVVSAIAHLTSISDFALPMMVGVTTGAYSTICIAGPLWVSWEEHKEKKEQRKKLALQAAKAAKVDLKASVAPAVTESTAPSAPSAAEIQNASGAQAKPS